jgi:hypothetical protein
MINYNLSIPKGRQVTKEAFSSQKENIRTSKHEISAIFLLLGVILCPPLLRIPNMDPDPLTRLNPDPQPWDKSVFLRKEFHAFTKCCRSGFVPWIRVRIRIEEGKNDPQT